MPEPCTYQIGGITVSLIPDREDGIYDSPANFSNFQSLGPADIQLPIRFSQSPSVPTGDLVFDSHRGWRQYSISGGHILKVSSNLRDPRLLGIFSTDFKSGEIFTGRSELEPDRWIFPFSYPMGELYFTNLLGTGLGLMLHACGVIYRGEGLLFAGLGDAGKSTTARLWQQQTGARVVNDDRVIVRKTDDQFRLYGTPWPGQEGLALAAEAPLKRIFILMHAPSNRITPLTTGQAVVRLLARSFSPFWSTAGLQSTLLFLTDLCREIPCHEFGFLPDQSAVDFICNHIEMGQ